MNCQTKPCFLFFIASLLAACGGSDDARERRIEELKLPPGFESIVVFEGTGESREIYIREDGDLFVSLAGRRDDNQILGLRDSDGDFVIDIVEPFYRVSTPVEQRTPHVHIEYFDGYLFAATNEQLVRMPLPNGSLTATGEIDIIVDSIPYQSSHRARTLSIDPDDWVPPTLVTQLGTA